MSGTGQTTTKVASAEAAATDRKAAIAPNCAPKSKRLCKALQCTKFRQGKCNGYCVACFYKFGETTCRHLHCINQVHKDGYCLSHLDYDKVDAITATKVEDVSDKPPPPPKKKKRKRDRIRYTFPKTSTQEALRIESTSKKHPTITRDHLESLFDSILNDTRHAYTSDGKTLYLLDEIKNKMEKALDISLPSHKEDSHKEERKPLKTDTNSPEIIQGMPEESFTAEEVAAMPVVFSYYCDDPESEQSATLAYYETEQSRKKKQTAASNRRKPPEQSGKKLSKQTTAHKKPANTKKVSKQKTDEFPPSGWTMQNIERKRGARTNHFDTYYFSPKLKLKFRSKPEVLRFIALLESSGGDEKDAFSKFKPR